MMHIENRQTRLLVLIAICLIVACQNPFATRDPETPKSDQSTWIQPTSPDYVLINLRNAIREKNITNVIRCLADTSLEESFEFIAEPAVAATYPNLFRHWGILDEQNYLNQLMLYLTPDSTTNLELKSPETRTFEDSDHYIVIQDYELTIHHSCDRNDCPRYMEGQAEFRLVRNREDLWMIYRWSDSSINDSPVWSQLKAALGT